jgi:hypothetical protein
MSTPYSELLKHPKWQKKRLHVLSRDNFTCQYCGDTEMELHVHHIKYEKGKSPIEISPQYLLTLCRDCHFNITNMNCDIESPLYYCFMHAEIFKEKRMFIRDNITKTIKKRNK